MGHTLDARGKPIANDTADPQADFQAAFDWADKVGAGLRGTADDRGLLTAGQIAVGQFFVETDTGKIFERTAAGWIVVFAPATAAGSVVPTALAGFTFSSNNLYTRNGFLLGSIAFAKASGTLAHGDTVMTLPVGSRPIHEYNVQALLTLSGSPSTLGQVRLQTTGVIQIVDPPAGRTAGTVSFVLPIPL